MIVSNRYVQITNGKKQIKCKNYICNKYLKYINNQQFYSNDSQFIIARKRRSIARCVIKLDTLLSNPDNATASDFDFQLKHFSSFVQGNSKGCTITYLSDSQEDVKDIDSSETVKLNNYQNRNITGIGFANVYGEILAYLDTSSYSIKVITDEILSITRVDDITSNMECVGFDYPLHISEHKKEYSAYLTTHLYEKIINSRLYSVGFGTKKGKMNYEYKLDDNEIIINKTDTTFSFSLKTGQKITAFPHNSLRPSSSKYPLAKYIEKESHPLETIHPSSSRYPIESNFKYIIFKYQIVEQPDSIFSDDLVLTNKFYTMNLKNEYIGLFEVLSKIERRT